MHGETAKFNMYFVSRQEKFRGLLTLKLFKKSSYSYRIVSQGISQYR